MHSRTLCIDLTGGIHVKRLPRERKTKKNRHCCGEEKNERVSYREDYKNQRRKKERGRGKKESHNNCIYIYIYLQHNTFRRSCVSTCLLRIGFARCSKKPWDAFPLTTFWKPWRKTSSGDDHRRLSPVSFSFCMCGFPSLMYLSICTFLKSVVRPTQSGLATTLIDGLTPA